MPTILIDNHVTELIAGYTRIRHADVELQTRWRNQMMAAYMRRQEAYHFAQAQHREHVKNFKHRALIGCGLVGFLFVLGLFVILAGVVSRQRIDFGTILLFLGTTMMLAAIAGGGLLGIMWFWQVHLRSPRPPQSPLDSNLLESLLPQWREGLQGQLPAQMDYEGAVGEHHFVAHLQKSLPDLGFVIYRLQQTYGDDVDVTIVGPKGVWVFEVKYWSGRISLNRGSWRREKTYYAPGGVLKTEIIPVDQPPDQQWRRMADAVAETLHRRERRLLARLPQLSNVQGGLVFTHPDASITIPPGSPVMTGDVAFWTQQLERALAVSGLTERDILELLEALLNRHRQVTSDGTTRSMDVYAQQLIQEAMARINTWMQNE